MMVSLEVLKGIFKPYELDFIEIDDLFDGIGIDDDTRYNILFESECSKSFYGGCVNTECPHNFIEYHGRDEYERNKTSKYN